MKDLGKPVQDFKKLERIINAATEGTEFQKLDFSNTKIAFAQKSDDELKNMAWLFKMMNKSWLVSIGSSLGLLAVKLRLPFARTIVKKTIFKQFCGGTTLLKSQPTITQLYQHNVLSVLDYGAEAKSTEVDFNKTMNETIRAIDFAAANDCVPVVVSKISGLARNELLEKMTRHEELTTEERSEYTNVLKRVENICHVAANKGVAVFFDAEESWVQDAIDHFADLMMARHNKKEVVVYNTFQMYRHDRLQFLMDSFAKSQREGYMLGAKLVRGAYMDKERARAKEMGYPSPIQSNKAATDDAFNTAVRFCIENYEQIASCNASHNKQSVILQANLIAKKGLPRNHKHLNFCQLLGMSDHLTFNLSASGYNAAKYLVYGPVGDVLPYLVRRAQENSSVTGDMSRELELIMTEVKRRNI
jgi:proline dehydrogenase